VGNGDGKQIKVASDPQSRKLRAIETIFEGNILAALSEIIFHGQTDKIKWQASVLMKLLAKYGPSPRVFVAIKEKNCLDALISLRNVPNCKKVSPSRLFPCFMAAIFFTFGTAISLAPPCLMGPKVVTSIVILKIELDRFCSFQDA